MQIKVPPRHFGGQWVGCDYISLPRNPQGGKITSNRPGIRRMPVTIPVVVGGLIALTGGVLGPWMLQGGREKTDARKKKAEKFEELVIALYEYDHWLDTREQHWVYGNEDKVAASPLAKVQAILSVYFSQFANALSEL